MNFTRTPILLLFLTCLFCSPANGQYNEIGIQAGVANYKGELSPHTFNTDFIHPAFGAFFRHNWNRHWSWKLEYDYVRITDGDGAQLSGTRSIFPAAPGSGVPTAGGKAYDNIITVGINYHFNTR